MKTQISQSAARVIIGVVPIYFMEDFAEEPKFVDLQNPARAIFEAERPSHASYVHCIGPQGDSRR